ncbi:2-hydroxychromene-2-carboxylate isomerase [Siccirubricoccus sp. KC 17139]|uniref:2-hydroxychromene-2-carboxylate isomerase n=1 Tax=Siccirubricoccus soli TaxID=2899147 RepID=A0ABT1DB32_9PROT|nr:2-hydroxychromene-2-carboxylate isomerase [Siccirubricoccus soli]MCO6419154.1 2-hydroxychromene-2-carboxylate isomerase [Siccirubricoccus soli]MCP2685289.1 2-hydroxychromene-2-carboxylate isomerase [Siccirubricoccus soli]
MALHIDYYASLNSPWTHLGAARIEALAAQHGASLRIWPVDFGTIFPASGGFPLPKRSPQRQAYRLQELARWREHLGIPIHIRPKHFPAKELPAATCVIAVRETIGDAEAIRLGHRILKACWEDELDPGDLPTLGRLIAEVGLEAEKVLALGQEPRWAEKRLADTQAALDRGVFGAPTYVIGEDLFWGQDRLEFVAKRLARG